MSKLVHNYKLLNILGTGEYGTVYKAENIQTNQFYAVKQVR
jgi:serine/threonine protein kinase